MKAKKKVDTVFDTFALLLRTLESIYDKSDNDIANGTSLSLEYIESLRKGIKPKVCDLVVISNFFKINVLAFFKILPEEEINFENSLCENFCLLKLTDDEKNLLSNFQSLTPYMKNIAVKTMAVMAGNDSGGEDSLQKNFGIVK